MLYIVSGQGAMTHGTQTIALKPGMVVHVPKGEVHAIKAQGGELTLLDFAQPPSSSPTRWSGSHSPTMRAATCAKTACVLVTCGDEDPPPLPSGPCANIEGFARLPRTCPASEK